MRRVVTNMATFSESTLVRLRTLFKDKPNAWRWITRYGNYVEAIDDLVDEEKSVQRIRDTVTLANLVFCDSYWLENAMQLRVVELLINNEYFDSETWSQSNAKWKRVAGKVLSHTGLNMLLGVIIIEFGPEVAADISLTLREESHLNHINDTEEMRELAQV